MKTASSRPTKKQLQTAKFATLYPNGVVIVQHEKEDPDAGSISFVTAWETTLYTNAPLFFGRYCFRLLFAPDFKGCRYVKENGSQNTRELGIACSLVMLEFEGYELPLNLMPALIHSEISTVNPAYCPTPDMDDLRVTRRYANCSIANLKD